MKIIYFGHAMVFYPFTSQIELFSCKYSLQIPTIYILVSKAVDQDSHPYQKSSLMNVLNILITASVIVAQEPKASKLERNWMFAREST
jgi:hypothetical protein